MDAARAVATCSVGLRWMLEVTACDGGGGNRQRGRLVRAGGAVRVGWGAGGGDLVDIAALFDVSISDDTSAGREEAEEEEAAHGAFAGG